MSTITATLAPHAAHPIIATGKRWLIACGMSCLGLAAVGASAAPVVVGSVNPTTQRVTVFEDLMVRHFADGAAITRFHGAYSVRSKAYYFVRSGKSTSGSCRTEVFRLVRLSGNRLAIAESTNPSVAWSPKNILSKMYATFDCTSTDCFDCLSGKPGDPLGADLDNPGCVCDPSLGALGGTCNTTKPGLGGPYGPDALITLTPS